MKEKRNIEHGSNGLFKNNLLKENVIKKMVGKTFQWDTRKGTEKW